MTRLSLARIAAVIMLGIVALNIIAAFAVFRPGEERAIAPNAENQPDVGAVDPVRDELIEDVGGLTAPTGLANLIASALTFIAAIGLLFGQRWELGAMLALGTHSTFRLLNIFFQTGIGDSLADTLPAILLLAVEGTTIVILYLAWRRSPERAASPYNRATPIEQVEKSGQ
ncbi:MAG: hypothetical protein MUF87_18210 [Anaerolineae bacterium]|jgi:hypothetical protein|nr:hypothetical protein [Anaerolineae bacterium]